MTSQLVPKAFAFSHSIVSLSQQWLASNPFHNEPKSEGNVTYEGSSLRIPLPARVHQLPAVAVEAREFLRAEALSHGLPQLFLVLTSVKRSGKLSVI